MTEKEFNRKFKGVNAPIYRGAPMPPFDPAMVNESKFADELRVKWYYFSFIEGDSSANGTVNVKWESQEWDADGIDGLVEEIRRCLKHIGFVGNVVLEIWERGEKGSGEYEAYREFDVI